MATTNMQFGQSAINVVLNEGQLPAKLTTDASGNTVLVVADGMGIPFNPHFQPRLQSIHDVELAEPLFELTLPTPYGVETATAGGKYEFAYGTPVYSAKGFNGYRFWMVGAPYPTQGVGILAATATPPQAFYYENPCIFVSNDGENWVVPTGMVNPIASGIGLSEGYYADPYIAFNADYTKLYVTFMWTGRNGTTKTSLLVTESSDGVTWTTPVSIDDSTDLATSLPNSPSLFWNGNGWTCIAVNTKSVGGYTTIIKTTTSATPYTGWSAWSTSTWTHPLAREWWHAHFVPLAGGEIIGMAVDNNSAGGAVYTLQSHDGGVNFSVKQFSAHRSASVGGSWYRPSVCVVSDGVNQSLIGYFGRISPLQQAGFFIQKARLVAGAAQRAMNTAILEDIIHRQVTTPTGLLSNSLAMWDSFNRADSAATLGTADDGVAWTAEAGTFGILTNRAYNTTAAGGNSIVSRDPKLQDFEYSAVVATVGTQFYLTFNMVNTSNYFRFGQNANPEPVFQKIVAGAISVNLPLKITIAAGDRFSVRRQGKYITLYHNGRPIDTYMDSGYTSSTKVGLQAAGASATHFEQVYVKPL